MIQQKLSMQEYRELSAVSNSELLTIERSPSDFIWSKRAPVDTTKTGALDFGTMVHTALLEPELFGDNLVIYDQTKSRDTVKFNQFMNDVDGNAIVLLESEYDKLRLMVDSAKSHPTFNHYLTILNEVEQSIYGDFDGAQVKIRPDVKSDALGMIGDLKTTDDLAKWRESATWRNPLFALNYGHTAAFYMDVYGEYLGKQVNEYHFLILQKNVSLGRYPVDVISITREECNRYGFFDRVYSNIAEYKTRNDSGDWLHVNQFPAFKINESVTIEFED